MGMAVTKSMTRKIKVWIARDRYGLALFFNKPLERADGYWYAQNHPNEWVIREIDFWMFPEVKSKEFPYEYELTITPTFNDGESCR